jgi:hypothetical protein
MEHAAWDLGVLPFSSFDCKILSSGLISRAAQIVYVCFVYIRNPGLRTNNIEGILFFIPPKKKKKETPNFSKQLY